MHARDVEEADARFKALTRKGRKEGEKEEEVVGIVLEEMDSMSPAGLGFGPARPAKVQDCSIRK